MNEEPHWKRWIRIIPIPLMMTSYLAVLAGFYMSEATRAFLMIPIFIMFVGMWVQMKIEKADRKVEDEAFQRRIEDLPEDAREFCRTIWPK